MRHLSKLTVLFLGSAFIACDDGATDLSDQALEVGSPAFTVIGGDNPEGAIVLNKGEASEPATGTCTFSGGVTTDVTLVRRPNGGGLLSCHWEEFPAGPQARALVIKDFNCFLNFFGSSTTSKSHFTLARSGVANMHCTFDEIS